MTGYCKIMHFVDPTTNMRVDTGAEFHLSLKGINDSEIPGINVVLSAMSLVTRKTRMVLLKIDTHVIALERVSQSVFNVQEMARGRIAQTIPMRVWHDGVPVAGYKASRDGHEIQMHDVDFVPYKLVVEGIDTNNVQAIAAALWNIQLDVEHIEVCMEDSVVKRTHIHDARFRMTVKDNHRTKMTVRMLNNA